MLLIWTNALNHNLWDYAMYIYAILLVLVRSVSLLYIFWPMGLAMVPGGMQVLRVDASTPFLTRMKSNLPFHWHSYDNG